MCGGPMHVKSREHVLHVPGNPRPMVRVTAEWICPECDYFEDAEIDDEQT
jgi:hypothetical protein